MSKQRGQDSQVLWTDPTGRRWLSPSQHQPAQPAVRALPAVPDLRGPGDPYDQDEDGSTDLDFLSGATDRQHAPDPHDNDTDDHDHDHDGDGDGDGDPFEQLYADRWGIALDDPTRWAA